MLRPRLIKSLAATATWLEMEILAGQSDESMSLRTNKLKYEYSFTTNLIYYETKAR